ncbi:MAG TPA: tetratricopeptide repeat protein [candidate division Zixibacteria bacterium]|nr:tetratricopeptide repeat protein [candidate division Zixibacteria bacterium]
MPTASKRVSRKELREPDKFLIVTGKALEFVRRRKIPIALAVGLLVLAALGGLAFNAYKDRQNALAAPHFERALERYHAGNYKEALSALEKVKDFRWSRYAALAYLYEANTYVATGELDKALTAAQRFLAAAPADSLYRQIALITLADVESLKGMSREAVGHYAEAEKIPGPLREQALIGKARNYARAGDPKAAIAAYRQLLGENPPPDISTRIELEIARLESQPGTPPQTP